MAPMTPEMPMPAAPAEQAPVEQAPVDVGMRERLLKAAQSVEVQEPAAEATQQPTTPMPSGIAKALEALRAKRIADEDREIQREYEQLQIETAINKRVAGGMSAEEAKREVYLLEQEQANAWEIATKREQLEAAKESGNEADVKRLKIEIDALGGDLGFIETFAEGLRSFDWVPVGTAVRDFGGMAAVKVSLFRIERGEGTFEDDLRVKKYLTHLKDKAARSASEIGAGVAIGSIPFAVEMYLSGGLSGVGKAGLKRGLARWIREGVEGKYKTTGAAGFVNRGLGAVPRAGSKGRQLAEGLAGTAVGAAGAYQVVGAPRVMTGVVQRTMPGISETEAGELLVNTDGVPEEFWDSFQKSGLPALVDNWIEVYSEKLGPFLPTGGLSEGVKRAFHRIGVMEYMKKKGITTYSKAAADLLKKGAYDGFVPEYLEERLGGMLRKTLLGEGEGFFPDDPRGKEHLGEIIGLMAPFAASQTVAGALGVADAVGQTSESPIQLLQSLSPEETKEVSSLKPGQLSRKRADQLFGVQTGRGLRDRIITAAQEKTKADAAAFKEEAESLSPEEASAKADEAAARAEETAKQPDGAPPPSKDLQQSLEYLNRNKRLTDANAKAVVAEAAPAVKVIQRIAKAALGIDIVPIALEGTSDIVFTGATDPTNTNRIFINQNANITSTLHAIAAHEMTHLLEGTAEYDELYSKIEARDAAGLEKAKSQYYDEMMVGQRGFADKATWMSSEHGRKEALTRYVQANITNARLFNALARDATPNLINRMIETIRDLIAKFGGNSERTKTYRDIEKMFLAARARHRRGESVSVKQAVKPATKPAEAKVESVEQRPMLVKPSPASIEGPSKTQAQLERAASQDKVAAMQEMPELTPEQQEADLYQREIEDTLFAGDLSNGIGLESVVDGEVRVSSTFSGMGVMEAALRAFFKSMGIRHTTVSVAEYDPLIADQFNVTHGTRFPSRNVLDLKPQEIKDVAPDILHNSPVCKNISVCKNGKRGDKTTEKDYAFADKIAELIEKADAPVVTVENTPGYETTPMHTIITKALDKAGYTWDWHIVDGADYGGVQRRRRYILRAVRDGELPALPKKTGPNDWYTAIKDLLDEAPAGEKSPGPSEMRRIQNWIDSGRLDPTKPIITMGHSAYKDVPNAANAGGPSPTLVSSERAVVRVILPDGTVKRVTGRMMARLMGLPDDAQIPARTYGKGKELGAKGMLGNGIDGYLTRAIIAPLLTAERISARKLERVESVRNATTPEVVAAREAVDKRGRDEQDTLFAADNRNVSHRSVLSRTVAVEVPKGFRADAEHFVEMAMEFTGEEIELGMNLMPEEAPSPLLHVTTDVTSVLKQGLQHRGTTGRTALGGGPTNLVSTTFSRVRAERIAEVFTLIAEGNQRTIPAEEVLDRMLDGAGFRFRDGRWRENIEKLSRALNRASRGTGFPTITSGKPADFIKEFEAGYGNTFTKVRVLDDVMTRGLGGHVKIDLLGKEKDFADLVPEDIRILTIAAREKPEAKGMFVRLRFAEDELQFHPKDLVVIDESGRSQDTLFAGDLGGKPARSRFRIGPGELGGFAVTERLKVKGNDLYEVVSDQFETEQEAKDYAKSIAHLPPLRRIFDQPKFEAHFGPTVKGRRVPGTDDVVSRSTDHRFWIRKDAFGVRLEDRLIPITEQVRVPNTFQTRGVEYVDSVAAAKAMAVKRAESKPILTRDTNDVAWSETKHDQWRSADSKFLIRRSGSGYQLVRSTRVVATTSNVADAMEAAREWVEERTPVVVEKATAEESKAKAVAAATKKGESKGRREATKDAKKKAAEVAAATRKANAEKEQKQRAEFNKRLTTLQVKLAAVTAEGKKQLREVLARNRVAIAAVRKAYKDALAKEKAALNEASRKKLAKAREKWQKALKAEKEKGRKRVAAVRDSSKRRDDIKKEFTRLIDNAPKGFLSLADKNTLLRAIARTSRGYASIPISERSFVQAFKVIDGRIKTLMVKNLDKAEQKLLLKVLNTIKKNNPFQTGSAVKDRKFKEIFDELRTTFVKVERGAKRAAALEDLINEVEREFELTGDTLPDNIYGIDPRTWSEAREYAKQGDAVPITKMSAGQARAIRNIIEAMSDYASGVKTKTRNELAQQLEEEKEGMVEEALENTKALGIDQETELPKTGQVQTGSQVEGGLAAVGRLLKMSISPLDNMSMPAMLRYVFGSSSEMYNRFYKTIQDGMESAYREIDEQKDWNREMYRRNGADKNWIMSSSLHERKVSTIVGRAIRQLKKSGEPASGPRSIDLQRVDLGKDENGAKRVMTMTRQQRIDFIASLRDPYTYHMYVNLGVPAQVEGRSEVFTLSALDIIKIQDSATSLEHQIAAEMVDRMNNVISPRFKEYWAVNFYGDPTQEGLYWPRVRGAPEKDYEGSDIGTKQNVQAQLNSIKQSGYRNAMLADSNLLKHRSNAGKTPILIQDAQVKLNNAAQVSSALIHLEAPLRYSKKLLTQLNKDDRLKHRKNYKYVLKRITDTHELITLSFLGGRVMVDGQIAELMSTMARMFTIGALGGNVKVALYQYASVGNAVGMHIPARDILVAAKRLLTRRGSMSRVKDLINTYSPMLRRRIEAGGDAFVNEGYSENRGYAKSTISGYQPVGEKMMVLTRMMDQVAVTQNWIALEIGIAREWENQGRIADIQAIKNKTASPALFNEFYGEVASRTWEVVRDTQPTWGAMDTSGIGLEMMRNPPIKWFGLFRSQRNKNMQMLLESPKMWLNADRRHEVAEQRARRNVSKEDYENKTEAYQERYAYEHGRIRIRIAQHITAFGITQTMSLALAQMMWNWIVSGFDPDPEDDAVDEFVRTAISYGVGNPLFGDLYAEIFTSLAERLTPLPERRTYSPSLSPVAQSLEDVFVGVSSLFTKGELTKAETQRLIRTGATALGIPISSPMQQVMTLIRRTSEFPEKRGNILWEAATEPKLERMDLIRRKLERLKEKGGSKDQIKKVEKEIKDLEMLEHKATRVLRSLIGKPMLPGVATRDTMYAEVFGQGRKWEDVEQMLVEHATTVAIRHQMLNRTRRGLPFTEEQELKYIRSAKEGRVRGLKAWGPGIARMRRMHKRLMNDEKIGGPRG